MGFVDGSWIKDEEDEVLARQCDRYIILLFCLVFMPKLEKRKIIWWAWLSVIVALFPMILKH